MPKSETNEAVAIAAALRPTVDEWERESSRSCVRMKKMTIASPYDGATHMIGVREAFASDALHVSCVPGMRGALVGSPVWVQWLYGDKSTMCVVGPGDASDYIDGAVNRNILDNGYLIGGGSQLGGDRFPINQRGNTSYTSGGYTIDRWRTEANVTTTVASTYVRFANNLADADNYVRSRNYISDNPPFYRTVTGTILYADGTMDCGSVYIDTDTQNSTYQQWKFFTKDWGFFCFELPPTGSNFFEWHLTLKPSEHVDIAAIKVEYGTASTLCIYDPNAGKYVPREVPDYQETIIRCKRYYQVFYPYYITTGYLTSGQTDYVMPVFLSAPIHSNATATAGTWIGRKGSGGYSSLSGDTGVSFQSLSIQRLGDTHYRLMDTRSSATSDTNNSVFAYYINNLVFKYDI